MALISHTPRRVAVDGIDAAGKTTLANELAAALQTLGRTVIRASIDGFHNRAVFATAWTPINSLMLLKYFSQRCPCRA